MLKKQLRHLKESSDRRGPPPDVRSPLGGVPSPGPTRVTQEGKSASPVGSVSASLRLRRPFCPLVPLCLLVSLSFHSSSCLPLFLSPSSFSLTPKECSCSLFACFLLSWLHFQVWCSPNKRQPWPQHCLWPGLQSRLCASASVLPQSLTPVCLYDVRLPRPSSSPLAGQPLFPLDPSSQTRDPCTKHGHPHLSFKCDLWGMYLGSVSLRSIRPFCQDSLANGLLFHDAGRE